jgi:hypothetical protein
MHPDVFPLLLFFLAFITAGICMPLITQYRREGRKPPVSLRIVCYSAFVVWLAIGMFVMLTKTLPKAREAFIQAQAAPARGEN